MQNEPVAEQTVKLSGLGNKKIGLATMNRVSSTWFTAPKKTILDPKYVLE